MPMGSKQIATCVLCGEFKVPWGDHIGPALMKQHQETDCPRTRSPEAPELEANDADS